MLSLLVTVCSNHMPHFPNNLCQFQIQVLPVPSLYVVSGHSHHTITFQISHSIMHSLPLIISYLTNAVDKFLAVNLHRKWWCPIQVYYTGKHSMIQAKMTKTSVRKPELQLSESGYFQIQATLTAAWYYCNGVVHNQGTETVQDQLRSFNSLILQTTLPSLF